MRDIRRDIEDLERFEEIAKILSNEGFDYFLSKINVLNTTGITSSRKIPGPERLRETLEKLGPTFVKFGQIMAQRPDIMPRRYTEELQKLEDDVPAFDSDTAIQIIREEIDIDAFEYVQEKPCCSFYSSSPSCQIKDRKRGSDKSKKAWDQGKNQGRP